MPADALDMERLPGHRWYESGQSAYSGPTLRLYHRLDALFQRWAARYGAVEHLFPPFIPASALARLDYFRSFPHLVTFPATLRADVANLEGFTAGAPIDEGGEVRLAALAPVRDVLTPAACYHFYLLLEGAELNAARFLTTRAQCFRREAYFRPLARQWSFSMREIVCVGTAEEVKDFLSDARDRVERFLAAVDLPVRWQTACDPFFNPATSAKYLAQRLDPVKTEMVFGDDLAIGSVNFHRNYFGEAFGIGRRGREAFSGCVAFGIDRWIHAWLSRFGLDERRWPAMDRE
jgi:seryl-tRNA synthetase